MPRSGDAHHADKVYSALRDKAGAAHSAVVASWSRSLVNYGLDPDRTQLPLRLTEAELAAAREKVEPLVRQSETALDHLFQMVGEAGCCVLLTDREGVPLMRRGMAGDEADFRRLGLWTGMVWSEACTGTNGVGTALAEERALTIHRDQHFLTRNIGLSCSVAPIWDAQGRLAGALDVSTCRSDLTPAMLKLIAAATVDAAQRIEASHFRAAFSHARIVVADAGRGPALLAVDREDLVIGANRAARLAYDLTDQRLASGCPTDDLLGRSEGRIEDLSAGERGVVQRALARAQGNVSAAARTLGISRATLHRKLARLGISRLH